MLTYIYRCTVCGSETTSRDAWLRHLIQESHQSRASSEFSNWNRDLQERSLVAYCNFPVGESDVLVQWFSNEKTLVADFVWNPRNPTIAVIQLESKEAVFQAIDKDGTDVWVTKEYGAKLRRGVELVDYQWPLLLGGSSNTCLHGRPVSCSSSKMENAEASSSKMTPVAEQKPRPLRPGPYPKSAKSSKDEGHRDAPSLAIYSQKNASSKDMSLYGQLKFLGEVQKVPEETYNAAQNLVTVLQTMLQRRFPGCTVHMFRNWHLKLRHDYSDYLLLYIGHRIPDSEDDAAWKSSKMHQNKVFDEILSSELSITHAPVDKCQRKKFGIGERFQFPSGFTFNVVTADNFLVEVQLSRLLQYLCTFSDLCVPLLTVVHYWAKSHRLMFQESLSNDLLVNHATFHCMGEPAALEWMVLLFLCREGLIPSPRDIQSRPHTPIRHPTIDVDIGFEEDLEYAAAWNRLHASASEEELALNVVQLAQRFFSRLGNALASGSWILNTRDGQLISTQQLLSKGDPIPYNNPCCPDTMYKFTEEEMYVLEHLNELGGRGVADRVNFNNTDVFRIYVVNPFYLRWRLSLANEKLPQICGAMKTTGQFLGGLLEYLETCEEKGIRADVNLSKYLS